MALPEHPYRSALRIALDEQHAMSENLTRVQTRCTELLEENRDLRRLLDQFALICSSDVEKFLGGMREVRETREAFEEEVKKAGQ